MRLETPRLIVRDFVDNDFQAIHQYSSDLETTRFMDWGPNTPDQTRVFLDTSIEAQSSEPRTVYDFGIIHKEEQKLIGGISFEIQNFQNQSASFGYILTKDYWGHGFATEAGEAVLSFSFEKLKLHRRIPCCLLE